MEMGFLTGLGIGEEAAVAIMEAVREEVAAVYAELEAARAQMERELLTREYLAGMRFVNEATRAYYAAQINAALEQDPGADRRVIFAALTTGEDGMALPNIFAGQRAKVELPPLGAVGGGARADLNAHRIVR